MNDLNIQKLIDDYLFWLKREINIAVTGEYYEITTPFLDKNNDYIQFYVKRTQDDKICLTDDGYSISELRLTGVKLTKSKINEITSALIPYGLRLDGDCITTEIEDNDFPRYKNQMIRAMTEISEMFDSSSEKDKNDFKNDVKSFLDDHNIFYTEDISLIGKTGSYYSYDFLFQKDTHHANRFCKTISTLNETSRNLTIFGWYDSRSERRDESSLIVLYNDSNQKKILKHDSAFSAYNIKPIGFSDKSSVLEELVS